jgi:hypothetical protein
MGSLLRAGSKTGIGLKNSKSPKLIPELTGWCMNCMGYRRKKSELMKENNFKWSCFIT